VLHIALGPRAIPGAVAVNTTMDSEDRFYAIFFLAYGAALLWCSADVERKTGMVLFLSAVFFVGGLTRLLSMAIVGPPNPFFLVMTALELLVPVVIVGVQRRIA